MALAMLARAPAHIRTTHETALAPLVRAPMRGGMAGPIARVFGSGQ
jgi:hypothetical protein